MIARVGVEVICIGYIYKPSRRQMDSVVAAVKELGPRVPRLNVSQFYEFAVERSLREYQEAPEAFQRNLREYLGRRVQR